MIVGKISRIVLIIAIILGIVPTLAKPAAASPGAPAFGLSSNYQVEAETPYSDPHYYVGDAQGLPDGKTAMLLYTVSPTTYQLRIYAKDGSLISSIDPVNLMDTHYDSMEVRMLALRDGNILITYSMNSIGSG